jgi:hypothetical protein
MEGAPSGNGIGFPMLVHDWSPGYVHRASVSCVLSALCRRSPLWISFASRRGRSLAARRTQSSDLYPIGGGLLLSPPLIDRAGQRDGKDQGDRLSIVGHNKRVARVTPARYLPSWLQKSRMTTSLLLPYDQPGNN